MRIAVTGTHGSGKTTLIDDFVEARPDYEREQEPYWALAQDGIPFADGVSLPDLEEQLAASVKLILAADGANTIFDRCPIDFLAYLEVVGASEGVEWEPTGKLLAGIEKALASLDLIVFVPLSVPDEVKVPIEFPQLRTKVDARLKRMLQPDQLEMLVSPAPPLLLVRGGREARLNRVIGAV